MNLEEKFITLTEVCKCNAGGDNPPADSSMWARVPGGCVKCKGSKTVTVKMSLAELKALLAQESE